MLNPITVAESEVGQAAEQAANTSIVTNVFKVLHGNYGNLFLSKYTTGKLAGPDEKNARGKSIAGQDKGIISAREIWAHGLQGFSVETVLEALERTIDQFPKFPPNLGEFRAICRACAPREVYRPDVPAIGMSQELRSARAARSREIVSRHKYQAVKAVAVATPPAPGLDALKQAIADAVATGGGDEAAALCRLDRMFPRKSIEGEGSGAEMVQAVCEWTLAGQKEAAC